MSAFLQQSSAPLITDTIFFSATHCWPRQVEPTSEISHSCYVHFLLKCSWVKLTLWIFNQPRVFRIQIWHQTPSSHINVHLSIIYFTAWWDFFNRKCLNEWTVKHLHDIIFWHSRCLCTGLFHSAVLLCLISPAVDVAFYPASESADTLDTLKTLQNSCSIGSISSRLRLLQRQRECFFFFP